MNRNTIHSSRVEQLRSAMSAHGVGGFIVPRADEWQGEFVPEYAERLKWISGFTGSGGAAVVLSDKAALMTDSRYTIQAVKEVDASVFTVVDIVQTSIAQWAADEAEQGAVIGYDPRLHTPKQLEELNAKDLTLKPVANLIDEIWSDQPAPPATQVDLFPVIIAGPTVEEKRADIAAAIKTNDLDWCVITLPDSIAWLLNIRAWDTKYIPVALSYLALDAHGHLAWFINPSRVPQHVRDALGGRIEIVHPKIMSEHLASLVKGQRVGLDFKRSPDWFRLIMEETGASVSDFQDPCIVPKAIKSFAEQKAIKDTHITDGVALTKFLAWVDRKAGSDELDEFGVAEKLFEFRAQNKAFLGNSFPTISGFGANGAIVHYRAQKETSAAIDDDGLLLVDSGGQYQGGTTDITRTVAIGEPTAAMRENFTRVLQGHIGVAAAVFKPGTLGKSIDALARAPLLEAGLNYGHGTGHGVGCFLGVHEEAASLSPRGEEPLKAGMLISNEPGYYEEGAYGIRTENLVLVVKRPDGNLGFETVSFAPIDRRLIVKDMLSNDELEWLNTYHAKVWDVLNDKLDGKDRKWLEEQVAPL